ncbi:MAG: 3-dehydroquinate synthase [Thermacetogeniaceae bacterium]
MAKELRVNLGERSYSILIGSSQLPQLGEHLAPLSLAPRLFVVTNEVVGRLYGELVNRSLREAGFDIIYYELPDGEEHKSLESAGKLYTRAIEGGLERQGAVIALGGGVIGDLAGFVAATYMRGVPFVQVPTTLLAQVDSSVGGKVAVNHPLGKNMIGCFYQPRLVFADVSTLKTLPLREVSSGLAEVIKYGVIRDKNFFDFLEENLEKVLALDQEALIEVVGRSCAIKAEIVEKDETEQGLRAILNFGHTIGHALEVLTEYRVYKHGEAVAAGMVAATAIAEEKGLCSPDISERLVSILKRAGLPYQIPFMAEEIMSVLPRDKKVRMGKLRFVLPVAIGSVIIDSDVSDDVIRAAIEKYRAPVF